MAEILRGKFKGKKVKIKQWCNDWCTAEVDGEPKVFSITNLKFDQLESFDILTHENNGVMEDEFEFVKDRFVRRKIVNNVLS